jgi:hypothetical protein
MFNAKGIAVVYCNRRDGSAKQQRWQTALVTVEGKTSAVHVATGLVGP